MSVDTDTSEFLDLVRIQGYKEFYAADIRDDRYFGFPIKGIIEAERALRSNRQDTRAYFSMEYGLATNTYNAFESSRGINDANKISENEIFSNDRVCDYLFSLKIEAPLDLPIYSGGLGVLAGDTIKTAADLKIPLAAIGILWGRGYFKQRFWFKFGQLPEEIKWDPASFPGLVPLEHNVRLELKERTIVLRLWKYYVFSHRRDFAVPLILLDSNVEENDEATRRLTDKLYRSDDVDGRLLQRLILGMGGMRAIEALGYNIQLHHLNEGHAAFAFLDKARQAQVKDHERLRSRFVYTCHTPVPAGHDRFSIHDLERILKPQDVDVVRKFGLEDDAGGVVNLTLFAVNTTRSVNAVSKKHGEVMRLQFPAHAARIKSVTNGVHFLTWASDAVLRVLDSYGAALGDFRNDSTLLKNVLSLKEDVGFRSALWSAHQENKRRLTSLLKHWRLKEDVLTVAWARRIAAYKRPSLLFQDIERLKDLSRRMGPIQILYAGKAHPNDSLAFTYINNIMNTIDKVQEGNGSLRILMLENYDTTIARLLVAGVDIWLNNPLPPYEASGTSGMKAIANGVLQLSTVDGWVAEACERPLGRFFGHRDEGRNFSDHMELRLDEDSKALYASLEDMMRLYYADVKRADSPNLKSPWIDMMVECLAAAGYFNTFRMVKEYQEMVWALP